ncbi:unnamed protein product [Ixodes persulcatus]
MCGKNHSVYTMMKEVNPKLILPEFTCHSLHLACSEATGSLPANIEFHVRESYNWFSCSPKRQQQYRSIYFAINEENPLKLVGMSSTRWFSVTAAVSQVLEQWNELKLHFEIAESVERCYTARLLHGMFKDEKNNLYMLLVKPNVIEFDRVNRLFRSEKPNSSKLFEDMDLLERSMQCKTVLSEHAFPTVEWEKHLLHVRACAFGTVFLDAFHKSSLSDDEKDGRLDRCRMYPVACVRSLLR